MPIVCTIDKENYDIARKSGIYYLLGPEDNWQKEVAYITGGRMSKSVVYVSDCNIPPSKAFSLASYGADVAITGFHTKSASISFGSAVKKQLDIHCINSGYGNTSTSINLIANKAINLTHLPVNTAKYADVPDVFASLEKELESKEKITETVIDLM